MKVMRKAMSVPSAALASADENIAVLPSLERDHVQKVYDAVATEWHGTRYKAWPKVVEFIEGLPTHSLIADLGCGNGKLAPTCKSAGHQAIGCDFSIELVRIAALQLGLQAQAADVMALPYRSEIFDAAVSIAVLHHVSTQERRKLLVTETLRVLRPGGLALFYAWAADQSDGRSGHDFAAGADVFVPFHSRLKVPPASSKSEPAARTLNASTAAATTSCATAASAAAPKATPPPPLPLPPASATGSVACSGRATEDRAASTDYIEQERVALEAYGGVFDAVKRAVVFQRYCHVYQQDELRELMNSVGGIRIVSEYYDTGNHCILVEKNGRALDLASLSI
jgi:alkylated DNA repair protein alkB family protein 8